MPTISMQDMHPKHRNTLFAGAGLVLIAIIGLVIVFVLGAGSKSDFSDVDKKINLVDANANLSTIKSDLGFEVSYNKDSYVGEADAASGDGTFDTIMGDDVLKAGSYYTARIYRSNKNQIYKSANKSVEGIDLSSLNIVTSFRKDFVKNAKAKYGENTPGIELTEKWFTPSSKEFDYAPVGREKVKRGDVEYQKVTYKVTPKDPAKANLIKGEGALSYYYTFQNDRPYRVEIVDYKSGTSGVSEFDAVFASIKYSPPSENAKLTLKTDKNELTNQSSQPAKGTVDRLRAMAFAPALAADGKSQDAQAGDSMRVSGVNIPATVKLYNSYCTDIVLKNNAELIGCQGSMGSGFFISSDGYIGTNGHVVVNSPKDLIMSLIAKGDPEAVKAVLIAENPSIGEDAAEAAALAIVQDKESLLVILGHVAKMGDSYFHEANKQESLVAQLTERPPKFDRNTYKFTTDDVNVPVKLEGSDYKFDDLLTASFTASDVAIVKADVKNSPVTTLGDIKSLAQGAPLVVIGFPGAAESELVDNTEIQATATKGVVSAIKKTQGNGKMLIQTDASISGGNSGGPAFNTDGEVIGLATYGIKDPQAGGAYNYLRDIADLKDLAKSKNINLSTESATQSNWQEGMDLFSERYFSKAIKKFTAAKATYPNLYLADEYIALAQEKIKKGEEAVDLTWVVVLVVILLLGGAAATVIALVMHKKHQKSAKAPGQMGAPVAQQPGNMAPIGAQAFAPIQNPTAQATTFHPSPTQPAMPTQAQPTGSPTAPNTTYQPAVQAAQVPPQTAMSAQNQPQPAMSPQAFTPTQQAIPPIQSPASPTATGVGQAPGQTVYPSTQAPVQPSMQPTQQPIDGVQQPPQQ